MRFKVQRSKFKVNSWIAVRSGFLTRNCKPGVQRPSGFRRIEAFCGVTGNNRFHAVQQVFHLIFH
jgi:hypothetical protein